MASIYKHTRGNTPYWICVYRDATGKQRHRSTKTKDRGEAEEVCQKWQRQADKLRDSHTLENKELVMESFIAATQKAQRGEFTDATARQMLNELLAATGQAPMKLATAEEFLTSWVNSKEIAKAAGTAKRYRHTVESFVSHLGAKARQNLASLTARDIETFRDAELKAGKNATTANMAVKTLRIPLNLARRQGLILSNPAEAVDMLGTASATRSAFTIEQLNALDRVADSEWRGMILLGWTAGLRLGDAARLTWADIDLERKVIRYFPQKTAAGAKRRAVETIILEDLEKWLLDLPVRSKRSDAPLFPKLSQLRTGGCNGLSARFRKLMVTAEIETREDKRKIKGKGRKFNELTFHSLRHTYISMMANIGVRKELRMKLAGHTSDVHERYTHLEIETFRRELTGFPSLPSES